MPDFWCHRAAKTLAVLFNAKTLLFSWKCSLGQCVVRLQTGCQLCNTCITPCMDYSIWHTYGPVVGNAYSWLPPRGTLPTKSSILMSGNRSEMPLKQYCCWATFPLTFVLILHPPTHPPSPLFTGYLPVTLLCPIHAQRIPPHTIPHHARCHNIDKFGVLWLCQPPFVQRALIAVVERLEAEARTSGWGWLRLLILVYGLISHDWCLTAVLIQVTTALWGLQNNPEVQVSEYPDWTQQRDFSCPQLPDFPFQQALD